MTGWSGKLARECFRVSSVGVEIVAGDVCVSEREQPIEFGTQASVSMMLEVGDGIRE